MAKTWFEISAPSASLVNSAVMSTTLTDETARERTGYKVTKMKSLRRHMHMNVSQ